jgi:hypothetical protein
MTLIQIKRSTSNAIPATLEEGELAYSYASNTLFIGDTANGVLNVGGKYYADSLDNATAANAASNFVRRYANGSAQFSQLDILLGPTSNSHVATKQYVDDAVLANVTLASLNDVNIGSPFSDQNNKILVGNSSGYYVGVSVTGNVSVSNTGVFVIGTGQVQNDMLAANAITVTANAGLGGGGIVSLGNTISIDVIAGDGISNANGDTVSVDSTVVRTDRPQTLNGSSYTFSNTVSFNAGINVESSLLLSGNSVATQANLTLAHNQANAAYDAANNAKVTVYQNSAAVATTQKINFVNTTSVIVVSENDGGNANVGFVAVGGAAYDQANAAYAQANAAFDAANNNQVTVAANNGLAINVTDVVSTIYNTTISDGVQSVAVGGASAQDASVWRTRNIVQVLDSILFPDIAPTYTIPTITFTSSITGTREIGETITPLLTANGIKNDANTYTQVLFRRGASTTVNTNTALSVASVANVADQFGYSNPNNPNFRYLATYTDSFVVVSGATNWLARASYDAGVAKKNNKGVTDARAPAIRSVNAPQAACTTFDSSATTVTGIYPYFWGVSSTQPTAASIAADIAAGTTNKVLADATGTVTVTFNATSQYVWLAHIGTATSKTKWYNTALNNGDIGAGQFILAPVNQNVNSPNGFWTAQSFKIYISGFATTTSGSIEFRNT